MTTYLEGLAGDLEWDGFTVEVEVAIGDPAAAIAHTATEARAGLIAMSTHGRQGLARWALGSITEAVIQQATLPVMALHPPES
jgi:nucleotide-binding universal stress UspA family protein